MNDQEFIQGYHAYKGFLHQLALGFTKDKSSADDLVQDTVMRACMNWDKFKKGSNLRAWLATIMRNSFINQFRKRKRRKLVFDHTPNNHLIEDLKTTDNAGESSLWMEEMTELVESLDEDLRTPFLMMYEGYAYAEIAKEMGIPLGTVKSRIFWARKKLKTKARELYALPQEGEISQKDEAALCTY